MGNCEILVLIVQVVLVVIFASTFVHALRKGDGILAIFSWGVFLLVVYLVVSLYGWKDLALNDTEAVSAYLPRWVFNVPAVAGLVLVVLASGTTYLFKNVDLDEFG